MVRTRRSIEEENRVMLVSGPGTDAFLADDDVAAMMEGESIDEMLKWGTEVARRALVVGLEDRGRIALELARRGVFVTVVEPDESLHEPVRMAAEAEHKSIQLTFFASDYMKREFQSSGFDLAIFYSVLSRYNEPLVVLKKAARELRAGGRVFARIRVRPDMSAVRTKVDPLLKKIDDVPKMAELRGKVGGKVTGTVERLPVVSRLAALPDAGDLLKDVAGIFKIERHEQRHLLAPLVGWAGTWHRLPAPARRLVVKVLPVVGRVDGVVVKAAKSRLVATHLYIYGLKELGLGHTFRV